MIRIDEIIRITGAVLLGGQNNDLHTEINNFSTDTRTISENDFYIPLKGDNFDGENFINNAIEKKAAGYFTSSDIINSNSQFILKVKDTKTAYLQLANYRRKQINPKVIMITGSSGKTTTKELVYSVCSQKFNTVKTLANHNNEIGFCQTIFSMDNSTQVLIIEAGMRGFGEIELISQYAEPDISIITNIGTAHIGRLGSKQNIAKAKCEITKYQNPNGILIAHDDDLIKSTVEFGGEKIFYSIKDTNITKKSIGCCEFEYKSESYKLNIEGDYNIENSLCAIETALALKIEPELIKKGLNTYRPIEKRWETETINSLNIINDSYNANPESMKATLSTVFELYPNSVIILGNMGELGKDEINYHKQIADFINSKNTNGCTIFTVGELAKHISDNVTNAPAKHFQSTKEVGRFIKENLNPNTTIFLKASRSMKFEDILTELKNTKQEMIK